MVSAFTPYLTVDESLDAETLVNYGMSMNKLRPSAITSFTIPNTGTGTTPGGASVVWPDEESLADMRTAMDEGRMTAFVEELEARLEEERLDGTGGSAEDAPVQEEPVAPEDEIL
jgi:hypothetical protein